MEINQGWCQSTTLIYSGYGVPYRQQVGGKNCITGQGGPQKNVESFLLSFVMFFDQVMDHIIVESNRKADYCIQSCMLRITSYRSWKTVTVNEICRLRSKTANGYSAETYPKILFQQGCICRDLNISTDYDTQ